MDRVFALITKYNYLPTDKTFLLSEYKYHGSDDSILSARLQPFWNYCSLLLPPTLAPNMVTTLGFIGVVLAFIFLIIFSPTLEDERTPRLIYILMGILFFYYQTMDAIDGKHARNTKASSALGELFDHGLDALTTMVQTFCICNALQLGPTFFFFLSMLVIYITSYLVIWEDYVTDMLRFGKYNSPTEAIIIAVAILFVTGIFGKWIWTIGVGPVTLNKLVLAGSVILAGTTIYDSVVQVLTKSRQPGAHREQVDYNGALLSLLPMILTALLFTCYYLITPSLLHNHPIPFLSLYALISAYMQTRMVFARICGTIIPPYFVIMSALPVAIINRLFIGLNDAFVLYLVLLFVVAMYVHMAYHIIREMQEVLKIRAFHMGPKNIEAWQARMKELGKIK